eukprot:gene3095-biopygen11842
MEIVDTDRGQEGRELPAPRPQFVPHGRETQHNVQIVSHSVEEELPTHIRVIVLRVACGTDRSNLKIHFHDLSVSSFRVQYK